MAVTYSVLLDQRVVNNGSGTGNANYTSSSFSTTSGKLLVAVMMMYTGGSSNNLDVEMPPPATSGLVWKRRLRSWWEGNFACYVDMWMADNASGGSKTIAQIVTAGQWNGSINCIDLAVFELTGAAAADDQWNQFALGGRVYGSAVDLGAQTITLPGNPSADSIVIAAAAVQHYSDTLYLAASGADFTETTDRPNGTTGAGPALHSQTQVRTGSTSPSVSWANLSVGSSDADAYDWALAAAEFCAAGTVSTSRSIRVNAAGNRYDRATFGMSSANPISVCFWLKMVVDRDTYSFPFAIDNAGANYMQLGAGSTGTLLGLDTSGPGLNFGVDLVADRWVYMAFSTNAAGSGGTAMWLVPDGRSQPGYYGHGTVLGAALQASNALHIGQNGFGDWFNGSIANVKIWDALLTADELAAEMYSGPVLHTANLYAWYKFNEGPDILDSSSNGRTLTQVGTPILDSFGPPISVPPEVTGATFVTGRMWDDENGTDTVGPLVSGDYTELEWNLKLQAPATGSDIYQFRVYDGTTEFEDYAITPQVTVAAGDLTAAIPTATLQLTAQAIAAAGAATASAAVPVASLRLTPQTVAVAGGPVTVDVPVATLRLTAQVLAAVGAGAATATVPVATARLTAQALAAAGVGTAAATVPVATARLTPVTPAAAGAGTASTAVPVGNLLLSPQVVVVAGGPSTIAIPPATLRLEPRVPGAANAATSFDQQVFRWRNDDGSETTATWKAAAGVDTSSIKATNVRLRAALVATTPVTTLTPKLYYKKTTDSTWLPVPVGGAGPVVINPSSNVIAGGEPTTPQLLGEEDDLGWSDAIASGSWATVDAWYEAHTGWDAEGFSAGSLWGDPSLSPEINAAWLAANEGANVVETSPDHWTVTGLRAKGIFIRHKDVIFEHCKIDRLGTPGIYGVAALDPTTGANSNVDLSGVVFRRCTFFGNSAWRVSGKQLTSNVATITVPSTHIIEIGDEIDVRLNPADPVFDGYPKIVTAKTATTVSYAKTNANIAFTACAGRVSTSEDSDTTADVVSFSSSISNNPDQMVFEYCDCSSYRASFMAWRGMNVRYCYVHDLDIYGFDPHNTSGSIRGQGCTFYRNRFTDGTSSTISLYADTYPFTNFSVIENVLSVDPLWATAEINFPVRDDPLEPPPSGAPPGNWEILEAGFVRECRGNILEHYGSGDMQYFTEVSRNRLMDGEPLFGGAQDPVAGQLTIKAGLWAEDVFGHSETVRTLHYTPSPSSTLLSFYVNGQFGHTTTPSLTVTDSVSGSWSVVPGCSTAVEPGGGGDAAYGISLHVHKRQTTSGTQAFQRLTIDPYATSAECVPHLYVLELTGVTGLTLAQAVSVKMQHNPSFGGDVATPWTTNALGSAATNGNLCVLFVGCRHENTPGAIGTPAGWNPLGNHPGLVPEVGDFMGTSGNAIFWRTNFTGTTVTIPSFGADTGVVGAILMEFDTT